ncbi:MAG: hypothetical protein H6708_07700 [Kofleriaceae bacterium]|nr:hypothetical protein [Kofleriaceae bacterium]
MPLSPRLGTVRAGHALLRGGRWHLARPQSRALWTSATTAELADLFRDARLRRRLEDFLRLAASVVDDVGALLVFDADSVHLAVSISLRADPAAGCTWTWIARSLDDDESSAC